MIITNKEEQNNLVVYHNNLSELALKNFNAKERDLLMALCCRLKDCGTEDFELTFREIRKLANYKQTSNKVLGIDLDSMTDKLFSLGMKEHGDNGDIHKFIFFQGFDIYPEKGILNVSVGKKFAYLINQLGTNFTQFQLEEHTSLKSSYSKECYRQLMRFKDKGVWWVYADRFRELMDLPPSYRDADIKAKVLPKIEEELAPLFESFEFSTEYRGNKPYKYQFRFNRTEKSLPQDNEECEEPVVDTKQPKKKAKTYNAENDEKFIAFWEKYPRKVSKQEALKAWGKIRPNDELFSEIMKAIEETEWSKDKQYIPHPSTWLNQKRWEDEREPQQESIDEIIKQLEADIAERKKK